MTRQITVDIDQGIVLVIQDMVQMYGLIVAGVFGRMWDYCTREDGVCRASMETIGNDLGIDRATANRCAKKLCEEGYLEDLTPNLRNHPHLYRDTGKALRWNCENPFDPASICPEEKRTKKATPGWVYVIKSPEGYCKIGKTAREPDVRLAEFVPMLPFETEVMCSIHSDNHSALEAELHARFADKRVRGEWFKLNDSDVEYLLGLA